MAIGNAIGALFKRHKLKAASVLIFALVWAVLIFPYGDLADFASAKISDATGGAVFLDVDSMSLSLLPVGADLERVTIETPSLPAITVASLSVSPSISSFLTFRKGGSIRAKGLFKGNVEASYAEGEKTKSGRLQILDASLERVQLSGLNDFLRASPLASADPSDPDPMAPLRAQMMANLNLKGAATGSFRASFDPRMEQAPTGAFDLSIANFGASMASLLGMDLNFEKMQVVGRMTDSKVLIEKADLGSAKDEINAKLKGSLDLIVAPVGGQTRLLPGAYDFNVTLNASDAAQRRLGLFLDSITAGGGKVEKTSTGYAYRFRALSGGPGGMPRYLPAE